MKPKTIAYVKGKIKKRKLGPAPSVPFEPYVLEQLKDPEFAAIYLSESIKGLDKSEEETFEIFFSAVSKIIKARGVSIVADDMEMTRDALYKLFKHGNPKVQTLARLLEALDLTFEIVPLKSVRQRV